MSNKTLKCYFCRVAYRFCFFDAYRWNLTMYSLPWKITLNNFPRNVTNFGRRQNRKRKYLREIKIDGRRYMSTFLKLSERYE